MLIATLLLPLLVVLLLLLRIPRSVPLVILAPLPALALVVFPEQWHLPYVLTGLRLGVDATGRPLLLLAGLLWFASGAHARCYIPPTEQRRFGVFWLLTWVGTAGTVLAQDAVSFYGFYTWMGLSAYGLIVHTGSDAARRAGRVYLIMALAGEVLILPAVLLLVGPEGGTLLANLPARLAAHPHQPWLTGLVLAGFGVKLGLLPLHVWLPLAHPVAPTPASAVLSGVLVKLGLLGWLRFLPLGELALPGWSALCLGLGFTGAFYGVLVGVGQQHPKTVLAYSSISQMGLVIALVGIGLNAPGDWPKIATVLMVFSLHHGLVKGALFLGQGALSRGGHWASLGLVLAALALAGAPLTSGALAKGLYTSVTPLAPEDWPQVLKPLLTASSAATTVLLVRFLVLSWPQPLNARPAPMGLWLPWLTLLALGAWLPWWWAATRLPAPTTYAVSAPALLSALPPLLAGLLLALLAHRWHWPPRLPAGDLLALGRHCPPLPRLALPHPRPPAIPGLVDPRPYVARLLGLLERRLRRWAVAGLVFLTLLALLAWLGG